VTIVQPLNGSFFDGDQVKVDFIISGTEPKLVRILVDDKPLQLLTDVKLGQNTTIVNLPTRDCKISVIAANDFGASSPAVVNLRRNEHIFKPTLYILAIGVSKYDDPELRLQFAAKDAIDFSLSMVQQQGLLYEKVELRMLTDEQASSENIRRGLQWLQNETTFGDVAMLYMAGHGINNNIGEFFFMPVNAEMNSINATCVSYREIKSTIDAVAGKMLVFMDACHSGNVLGANLQRAAMIHQAINDLTGADNGAVIFTSSTGRQFSLENPVWNNGAFTKALVEGLNGAADLFNRQTITVNTLSSYVAVRVRELTNGQQAPTTIIPSSVPDFPIAVVNVNVNVTVNVNIQEEGAIKIEDVNVVVPVEVRIETAETKLPLSTTVLESKQFKNPRLYVAISAGASSFGSYSHVKINSGGSAIIGAGFAYYFTPSIGVGLKYNVASCNANFREFGEFYYKEQISFVGPALYGKLGNKRKNYGPAFTFGAGVGSLKWTLSEVREIGSSADDESYSSLGSFLSVGFCYMFSPYMGFNLNIQSLLGSLEDQYGYERKPTGIGGTLGVCFKF